MFFTLCSLCCFLLGYWFMLIYTALILTQGGTGLKYFLGYLCIENVNAIWKFKLISLFYLLNNDHFLLIILCSFVFLFIPWYILEKPEMEAPHMQFNFWIFFSNALCALALNFSTFLVIGRTGAVTIRVAGVLKDWLLISLSTVLFPESKITGLNVIGYAIGICFFITETFWQFKFHFLHGFLPSTFLYELFLNGQL